MWYYFHCIVLVYQVLYWQCGLKYTGINLQTLQDIDLILTLENNLRGGISSVFGDRFVKSVENKKYRIWMLLIYMDIQ